MHASYVSLVARVQARSRCLSSLTKHKIFYRKYLLAATCCRDVSRCRTRRRRRSAGRARSRPGRRRPGCRGSRSSPAAAQCYCWCVGPESSLEFQTKVIGRFPPTSAFTFKTLLRHYPKRALTPRSLNVKLGPRRNYHKGRAAIRHYANQPARPL